MKVLALAGMLLCGVLSAHAQTSKDIFLMPGSDLVRPGLHPRSNLNIGIGITAGMLKRVPVGDELTFAYTYENSGSHGFWHTDHGSHTEALGLMKNMAITKSVGAYTWMQFGLTSMTGGRGIQNRFYNGYSVGLTYHFTPHHGIWLQEEYNKINTVPWYTSTNVGYVVSW